MLFPSKLKERYEIREELGAGGMGAVYRAYDKIIKSEVALKTLLDINDAESLRMFHAECDKLAKMVHPNIVEIRDIGEFDSGRGKQPYLVMPLLRGTTLDGLINKDNQRLSVPRAVDILCQACRGLQAAHDAGLIHRDLKPSNIFVLEDDSVKLIDFGVAHWSDNNQTMGRKGTLLFMAPEQIEMKGVSPLSDIFSLGVVAYQTLTGKSPFERRTEDEVVQAIRQYIPPPASEYNGDVSLSLSQAIHKAMAKQPSNRYRNAREFGDTLQKALHQQPIELFNPARIQPRIERANQALEKGDLELASEIVGELDVEGHLDPQVQALQRKIEQLTRRKRVANLLDGARTRLQEQEYPLALQKIQEALELDKNNSDALMLKESVERRRAEQSVNDWLQLSRQHIDNFAHDRAREALQNVLQLRPNDSRATAMLMEVDKAKSDYEKILNEKRKLHQAAEIAFGQGEVSSALSKMNRVLQLDKEAPDRTNIDSSTQYQSFYQQIRSEHDNMQNSFQEARALQVAGNYVRALGICNESLLKFPNNALLQALKLDLEVSQRQQLSGFIAEVDRRVDSEPDLDKRLAVLKDAIDKFPDVEHFETNYRLAREKRDLIESIVAKAHRFEEQGQINESVAQWEILRSIYDRYPGLDFEFQRLRKRQAHQAKSETRARLIDKIDEAVDRSQFVRALELIDQAKIEFPDDEELQDLERRARTGGGRVAEAEKLLALAEQMREEGRLQEAVDTLQKAHALDRLNGGVNDALQSALIEEARGVLETDWRTAEGLLKQAQELGSEHYAVKGLLRAVADRRREEEIDGILARARALQAAGDIRGAFALTAEKLTLYPQDLDIQQLHNRLKKQFEALPKDENRPVELGGHGRPQDALESEAEAGAKTTVMPAPGDAGNRFRGRVGERLMTVTPNDPGPAGRDTEAIAPVEPIAPAIPGPAQKGAGEKKGRVSGGEQPQTPEPFNPSKHKVKIGVGVALAGLLIGGAVFFNKPGQKEPAAVTPIPTPSTTIAITTTPPNGSLVINKSIRGVGNGSQIDVPAGNLIIEASLPGYQPITKQVFLNAGDKNSTQIDFQLAAPLLRVETALNGGQVFLDDKPAGELQGGQFALDPLPTGTHKVVVKADRSFGFTFEGSASGITASSLAAGVGGTLILVGNSQGKVQVFCNRTGLTLMMDGNDAGGCPTKSMDLASIEPGRHTLEVFEAGQSLGVKVVELGPATNLGVYLLGDSGQGILTVSGTIDEFNVSFDRHESSIPAKHGKWRKSLLPGDHLISARKDGYTVEPASVTVKVEKGKDLAQLFTFTAVPTTSTLIIKSEPGAEVTSNGRAYGTVHPDGTIEIPGVPVGGFPIQLRKKGFADYRGTVQVVAGQNLKPLTMQKERSHMTLTAVPAAAQIIVTKDGGTTGQTFSPPVSTDLAEGGYTIEVMAEGYAQETEHIRLVAGETYTHEFRLQQQKIAVVKQKPAVAPTGWPLGWELVDGYQTKSGGGFSPVATGVPSQVSFSASRERKKLLGINRGGTLNWSFVATDGSSALNFHLGEKALTWEGTGTAKEVHGRAAASAEKGEHSVKMVLASPGLSVAVDGKPVTTIVVDVPAFGTSRFGFRIDGGETLSVRNFSYIGGR